MLRRELLQIPAAFFFAPADRRLLEELTETIIPADAHSGGAKAAGVAAYIDGVLAATLDDELRRIWREGLALIDGKAFLAASPTKRVEIVQGLTVKAPKFFAELKRLTVAGYYTSRIGIFDELEYKGNRVRDNFTGCD